VKRVVVTGLGCITPIGIQSRRSRVALCGTHGIAVFDPNMPGAIPLENPCASPPGEG